MARVPGLRVRAGNRLGRARPRLQPARRPQRGLSAHGDSECVERDFRRRRRRRSNPRLNRRPHTPGPALWRRSRGCLRALAPGQWCLRAAALHAFEDRELLSRPPWDLHGCLRPVCRHGGGHRRLDAFSSRVDRPAVGGSGDTDLRLLAGARGGQAAGRLRTCACARECDRDQRRRGVCRRAAERIDPSRRASRVHRRRPGDRTYLSDRNRLAGQAQARRRPRHVVAVSSLNGRRGHHPGRHRRGDCTVRDRCGPGGAVAGGGWLRRLVLAGGAPPIGDTDGS